jgi:hypothetical protein
MTLSLFADLDAPLPAPALVPVRVDRPRILSADDRRDGFVPTPVWFAEALVARYFADLTANDLVLEPFAGSGELLQAIPTHVPAIGIELDAARAAQARARTGRPVHCGSALEVPLPPGLTAILTNPPFQLSVVERFLSRVHPVLPADGRVGMIAPVAFFQTSRTVVRWAEQFGITVTLIPRDLFPRLSLPVCFALLEKCARRVMVGLAFYRDVAAVRDLSPATQYTLTTAPGAAWRVVVTDALIALGGRGTLDAIYAQVAGRRAVTRFWKEKVRQQLQAHHHRVQKGEWELAA